MRLNLSHSHNATVEGVAFRVAFAFYATRLCECECDRIVAFSVQILFTSTQLPRKMATPAVEWKYFIYDKAGQKAVCQVPVDEDKVCGEELRFLTHAEATKQGKRGTSVIVLVFLSSGTSFR